MAEINNLLPTTIELATKGTPIAMLMRVVDRLKIEAYLAIEIRNLSCMVNVDERLNIQPHQIPLIAAQLVEEYKNEGLADFKICFQRGALGKYGEIYRLDAAVICTWMAKYLDEKYDVLVSQLNAQKENPYEVSRGAKTDVMLKLMKEALGDYKSPEEVNQKKEAQYQLYKREVMQRRKNFQILIDRTASEFYKERANLSLNRYDDDDGYYVMAESLEDAETIFLKAKETHESNTGV